MPLIIAHRGSSGSLPENTLEAFQLAIEQDADIIELDIVATKDNVLIIRHDVYLSRSTNVASLPKYSNKKSTKIVDGISIQDWFAIDFTYLEIQELKAIQPFLDRPQQHNNLYEIPTLSETIAMLKSSNESQNKAVGICIEIKNSTFHESNGKTIEKFLIKELKEQKWDAFDSLATVISFEVKGLKYIKKNIGVKVYQLFDEYKIESNDYPQPYDFIVANDKRTYKDMLSKNGLFELKKHADGLCLWRGYLVDKMYEVIDDHPNLVDYAHQMGFKIFLWTFNKDRIVTNCISIEEEYKEFYDAGVDGIITDYPQFARKLC